MTPSECHQAKNESAITHAKYFQPLTGYLCSLFTGVTPFTRITT